MIIKEIIVVEGKNDTKKIKEAVQADTIETKGLALTEKTIEMLKHAQAKRGIIIFTDPDYAGNQIRKRITEAIPNCKHAYLPRKEAHSNKSKASIGIEHASVEAIRHSLRNVRKKGKKVKSDITRNDLLSYGLIGTNYARERREQLGDLLHIGYANAKQLLHRLHMFQIMRTQLKEAIDELEKRGHKYG